MTLKALNTSGIYIWYSDIRTEETVDVVNYLYQEAASGRQIFYRYYSDKEIARNPEKAETGLFFFRGRKGAPFVVNNAGGGFMYVAAMHDSFPHALALSRMGYNAFAIIYRPETAYEDLARAWYSFTIMQTALVSMPITIHCGVAVPEHVWRQCSAIRLTSNNSRGAAIFRRLTLSLCNTRATTMCHATMHLSMFASVTEMA